MLFTIDINDDQRTNNYHHLENTLILICCLRPHPDQLLVCTRHLYLMAKASYAGLFISSQLEMDMYLTIHNDLVQVTVQVILF